MVVLRRSRLLGMPSLTLGMYMNISHSFIYTFALSLGLVFEITKKLFGEWFFQLFSLGCVWIKLVRKGKRNENGKMVHKNNLGLRM